jgi:hypothetical protein
LSGRPVSASPPATRRESTTGDRAREPPDPADARIAWRPMRRLPFRAKSECPAGGRAQAAWPGRIGMRRASYLKARYAPRRCG